MACSVFNAVIQRVLSIPQKIPEISGWGANGTDIFQNFILEFCVYVVRLA